MIKVMSTEKSPGRKDRKSGSKVRIGVEHVKAIVAQKRTLIEHGTKAVKRTGRWIRDESEMD
jgi:hypothetical protein